MHPEKSSAVRGDSHRDAAHGTPGGACVRAEKSTNKVKSYRVYSFPKAGRTWTTYLWYFYTVALVGRSVNTSCHLLRPTANLRFKEFVVPALLEQGLAPFSFTHSIRPGDDQEFLAKRLEAKLAGHQHAVIVRRPARILSSYYHHIRRRQQFPLRSDRYPDADKLVTVSDIVHSERYGIERVIDYYRVFDRHHSKRQFVLYYEDLLADTRSVFRRLLEHAGYSEISEAALGYAIEQSSFDRLQETQRRRRLKSGRPDDTNMLRFRVGGDGNGELTPEDQEFIVACIRQSGVGLLQRYT